MATSGSLSRLFLPCEVLSSVNRRRLVEDFVDRRSVGHLEEGFLYHESFVSAKTRSKTCPRNEVFFGCRADVGRHFCWFATHPLPEPIGRTECIYCIYSSLWTYGDLPIFLIDTTGKLPYSCQEVERRQIWPSH